jgi:26S proteasome non-ATPase regulatory subunit 9
MGMELPLNTPAAHTRTLITRKEAIEAELEGQLGILKANNSTLHSPLVDNEGFPRADLDIYAVRHARVRVIELRNDLSTVMDQIAKALETVYAPASGPDSEPEQKLDVFAKVNAVAPGSPAASAVGSYSFSSNIYLQKPGATAG